MWFWFLVLVGVIIYMATKKDNSTKNTQFSNQQFNIEAHNRQWAEYILSYEQVVKTKSEKALLKRMLTDLARQGMLGGLQLLDDDGSAIEHETQNSSANSTSYNSENMQAAAGVTAPYVSVAPVPKTKAQVQLDNASLLLYFGAFLLVASAGLFVAFAGLPGGLRTFIVALVSVGMYYAGLWLYANRPKLRQAGTAFVGIGMAIMPLVGLAAYNYVFNKGNAPFAWLLTSVLCLAMYSHALYKLRTTFLDYLFIFTIVSLFESAVSITNLPLYYFGWMLAFIGIAVTLLARYGSIWKDLQTPSSVSSTLFIPISVLVSLALIGHDGLGQLGVSLLLAGFYYALCIATSVGSTQQTNAIAAQLSLVSGISVLAYALNKNISFTFAVVLSVSALQTLPILLWGEAVTDLRINFATTSIASYLGATVLAFGHPKLFLLAVASVAGSSAIIWWQQHRNDAYFVSAVAWMLLPEIYALYVSNPTLSRTSLATLSGGVLALQLGLVLVAKKRFEQTVTQVDQYTYLISSAFVLFLSFFAGPWITVAITAGVVASYMLLAHVQGTKTWHLVAGYMALVPLLWGGKSVGVLLTANIGALLVNIYFALRYRLEVNRWISTGLWLLIPVSLGAGLLGSFSPAVYAWSYIVIMLGLIFSRAIARGSAFLSSKVPLASYISSKSSSYVVGYWLAAVVALYTSLYSANDRLQTSLILAVLTAFAVFISQKIEKNDDLMALVPLLLQTLLLSVWRPTNNNQITSYLLVSSMLTLVTYFAVAQEKNGRKVQSALQLASLVTVWIAPVSFLFIGHTLITMPLGFFVAALLNLQASKHITQEVKEAWQSVATLALMWLIYFAGVRVFQVYVHVLVAMFAVFAYIRHQRNEITQSNSYIYAMLATATVTLAVQALGGYAGGLYGWWLLLEEVAFMIMGMSLGKKFVTQWGLYVSVAAVLYQLRGLGWAALSFLALFLIGLAVYKIQKSNQ